LINCKIIVAVTLAAFLFSGCATLFPPSVPLPVPTYKPVTITVEAEKEKPLVHQALRKGQIAPADGVWFSKDSAKIVAEKLTKYQALTVRDQINEQILAGLNDQIGLLVASNELYRKEIERQQKWNSVKMVISVISTIGGIILGFALAK
jgi:hypothetical protein